VGSNKARKNPNGILIKKRLSEPPASTSNTRMFRSALNRFASTHPADPAPAIT
jgi:hypothetical protein